MKKKIFIMSHALELGGAERSLIGLLSSFDTQLYDVDLFLMRQEGELLSHIPDGINLLPVIKAYTVLARPMKDTLAEGHFILTSARLMGKIAARLYDKKHGNTDSVVPLEYSHKFTAPFLPPICKEKEYDLAISFLTPHYYVAQKVNAKKKVAWIHTDYTTIQLNRDSELLMWDKYDYIASISDSVTDGFSKVFPELTEKLTLIENILPVKVINAQKSAFDVSGEMSKAGIKLLSVGRYTTAKNFDNVPEICSRLIACGLDVYWYIIGFGGDENLIRSKIKEFNMESRVILLGKKENPYPYIDACDLYVQPSRYEGKSVTVREAQLMAKPVVITNYATSASQLTNGTDGIIVPMDNEDCAKGIAELLNNPEKINELITNCSKNDYSNAGEVTKLIGLISV